MPKKEYSAELTRMLARLKSDKVGTMKDYKKLSQEERTIYLEGLDKLTKRLGGIFHNMIKFDKDGNPE